MRSRSSSPTSSDASPDASVASSDFSELDHASSVDQLTTVLEQVDLSSTSSDDEGYEIVVLPMSSASGRSEQSQFSMLSISSASEANPESDSESSTSFGSKPARSAPVSEDASVATSSAVSSHLLKGGNLLCKTRVPAPGEIDAAVSDKISASAGSELSKGQRSRRNHIAIKEAVAAVVSGKLPASEASAGFNEVQRKKMTRLIQEAAVVAPCAVVTSEQAVVSTSPKLTSYQRKNRNRAAIKAAVDAVISGRLSASDASAKFDRAQREKMDRLISEAVSSGRAAFTTLPSNVASTESKLSEGQRNSVIREAARAGCVISSVAPQPGASAGSGISKNQRKKRNRAAVKDAASAVIAGTLSITEASAAFNPTQQANLQRLVLDHTQRGPPGSAIPSTRIPSRTRSKRRTASGYDGSSDSEDSDNSEDDSDDSDDSSSDDDSDDDSDDGSSDDTGSGYSTERSLSASAAASAINSFFSDTESFTSQQENKLLLWQALCIEFGLVEADELTDLPSRHDLRAQRSSAPSPPSVSGSESTSRSVTPTQRNPFPTSLTQAKALLSTAHVPLREYMALRQKDPSPKPGAYAYLLEPSLSALRKVLRDERAYVKLNEVKEAFLNPLLKDFGFHHRRKG